MLARLAAAASPFVLDVHSDPDHHRAVLTVGGLEPAGVEAAVRALTELAVTLIDLRCHEGVHPRFGVVDVVPFVPLDTGGHPAGHGDDLSLALAARDRFCAWAGATVGISCFAYGPERSLPEVRRRAGCDLAPETGPATPSARLGSCAVGARPALVAYNLWLTGVPLGGARGIASTVRGPDVRALGLAVGDGIQVSCNLIAPDRVGPAEIYQQVAAAARQLGGGIAQAELVGLVPARVLDRTAPDDWDRLDLDPRRTVEARLLARPPQSPRSSAASAGPPPGSAG